jgi:hypothetical protein
MKILIYAHIYLKPVLQIRIRSDPDLFGRIRIRDLINDSVSTFLVCVKAINTKGIYVFKLFGP